MRRVEFMIEIPEAFSLSNQINQTLSGKIIETVVTNNHTHKWAWFFQNEPSAYHNLLKNKVISKSESIGGMIEIYINDARMVFGDGVNLRYYEPHQNISPKNQLHIIFHDHSSLVASVQMYGGLWAFLENTFDNKYYLIAKEKASPLHDDFNLKYFNVLFESITEKLSLKAFLATEQRIPGLGNGVLQEILYKSKLHPKRTVSSLNDEEKLRLFHSIKSILMEMSVQGGRNTEKDLFGNSGNYETLVSKYIVGNTCTLCGHIIKKETYLGGSIYFCEGCQII